MTVKFPSGMLVAIVATPAALAAAREAGVALSALLSKHLRGEWGDLDAYDAQANEDALERGGRLFSSYQTAAGKIWIITEADRSATTVLLPSDY